MKENRTINIDFDSLIFPVLFISIALVLIFSQWSSDKVRIEQEKTKQMMLQNGGNVTITETMEH